jgi:hypothetical protein
MTGPVEVVLVIALVAYVLIRRMAGETAEGKRMLLLPAILAVVGVVDVSKVAQSGVSLGFLIASTVVSVGIGLLRGASVKVFERDGIVFMKYTVVSVILLVVNFGVRFGASFVLGMVDPSAVHAVSSGLMLTLGASLLVEGLCVLSKAVRLRGRIIWAKGKKGAPHQASSFLDTLQSKVQSTDWTRSDAPDAPQEPRTSLLDDLRDLDFRRPAGSRRDSRRRR